MAKAMDEKELNNFLNSPNITSLFMSGMEPAIKINAVCSTLSALGYDDDWMRLEVRAALKRRYIEDESI